MRRQTRSLMSSPSSEQTCTYACVCVCVCVGCTEVVVSNALASLWGELGHESDREARNTVCTRTRTVSASNTHTHILSSCWLRLNELEDWSPESHLSEQSKMRL